RLVSVHPFRNGNGRHSRFLADLYLHEIGAKQLSWGARQNLIIYSDTRKLYIAALHDADRGDIEPLIRFALS
ncbi:MAG: mobile mystery protein, partial [Actinomycetia bacterium]|nr:mobile mystery protein [Actinomycetes bacterium]